MSRFHRYRRLPLRAKLSLWVSVGVLGVVVAMMLTMLLTLEQVAMHSVIQVQEALVEGVVHDVDGKVGVRRDALLLSGAALGERLPIREGAEIDAFFASQPLLRTLFDTLVLADADGRVVYDSNLPSGQTKPPMADRSHFKQVMQSGEVVIAPPTVSRVASAPVINFAAPVRDRGGRITAVLVGLVRLDRPNFIADVGALHIGDGGYFLLTSRSTDASVIAHPRGEQVLRALPHGGDPGWAEAQQGIFRTVEGRDAAGTPSLISHRALASAPWMLEAVYPTEEAFAALRHQQRRVVAVGATIATISGLLVWWLTTRLLAPLGKLRRAMQLDATGSEELPPSIEADSADLATLLEAYYAQKSRRVATEAALGVSERRLRSITDTVPALICVIDRQERYRFANAQFRNVMGIEPDALVGQSVAQFLGPAAYADILPKLQKAFHGEHCRFEHTGWKGNAEAHFLAEYVPEIEANGEVSGLVVMVLDITERKRMELAFAKSEQRVRTITDSLPALILHYDRDLRYTFANAKSGEAFGFDPSSVIGRSLREVRGERVHAELAPQMARALAGETTMFETTNRIGDGPPQWFECNYIPEFDPAGEVIGFYALTFEITQRKNNEAQLRANQQLLDRTGMIAGVGGWSLEISSGAVRWTDETRRIHEVDDAFVPTFERSVGFYSDEGRAAMEQAARRAKDSGTPWDLVLPLRTAKGRSIWARVTGEVEIEHGRPARMFGAFQDVSQRVEHERQLREQAELLQVTLKSIGDGVITADERGCVRWMNPAAERMTGWTSEAASGRPTSEVFRIVHADTRAPAPDPVAHCLATLEPAALPARTVLLSMSGEELAVEDSASPIHDAKGGLQGAVLVFHDVSEQRRMTDQMTYRATHDSLTGLLNRTEFETRLSRVLAKSPEERVDHALMYIDLDQFKLVNDACGHAMGDKLLCQVSELLRTSVRSRDTLARLGGDEFGVLLEHCNVSQAQRVAQSICDRMEEFRFVHDGRRFRIGTSIGLVAVDSRWADAAAVQHAADAACYAAKEAGRNRVHTWFDTDIALHGRDSETQWGSRLEEALDDHDFVLYAQLIDRIQSRSTGLHFEVLIRLREADGTIIPPGRFLPAAERFHMASRIDRWVLRRVLEWLAAEGGSPPDIETISVNLSGQSIGDRAFHRYVVELLREIPVDPTKLCFEVTETAAITNLADASTFIREMRAVGMRVALDDFGAGASSFGYLKNLPVDYLKIDGQFIRNIETDPLDIAAVRCFHEVARAIGVQTIAEFVETDAVREVLRGIGIDHVQGYLVHKPEPLEDLVSRKRVPGARPACAPQNRTGLEAADVLHRPT